MIRHIPEDKSARVRPAGFTLVELLVAVTIVGILASIVLGALVSARSTARIAKTKATIAKLNNIMMSKYEIILPMARNGE